MHELQVGDTIGAALSGHSPGSCDAAARVLEVVRDASGDPYCYRVRWPDGRETMYRPARDVRVIAPCRSRSRRLERESATRPD